MLPHRVGHRCDSRRVVSECFVVVQPEIRERRGSVASTAPKRGAHVRTQRFGECAGGTAAAPETDMQMGGRESLVGRWLGPIAGQSGAYGAQHLALADAVEAV